MNLEAFRDRYQVEIAVRPNPLDEPRYQVEIAVRPMDLEKVLLHLLEGEAQ